MTRRFTLLPDERFASLGGRLAERVEDAARTIDAHTFPSAFDPLMKQLTADVFAGVGAHEGTIWLSDASEEFLVPVFNTGPNAGRFVGSFQQPLSRGLMSLVYKNGHPIAENAVHLNAQQDHSLDQTLGFVTTALIAVPLYFARRLRGTVSCVQLKPAGRADAPDPPGFSPEHLRRVEHLAAVLTRLLDHTLVGTTVGWPPA